jgi:hypothetical protein
MTNFLRPVAVACLAAAALDAQAPPPPRQRGAGAASESLTLTVTGCLRAGARAGTFVLVSSKPASASGDTSPAGHHDAQQPQAKPSPQLPAGSNVVPGETLRLAGTVPGVTLSDHVGHTVTVSGMIAPGDPVVTPAVVLPDTRPPGDSTSRDAGRGKDTAAGPRVLNIRSLTHVAGACK